MNKVSICIFVTSLLISTIHGYNTPECNYAEYGQIQSDSCTDLILDLVPFYRATRLFSLRASTRPIDITKWQWSNRVELPFFRENGQWLSGFKTCRHQLKIDLERCKLALLAFRFINGSISYDTSRWVNIRDEAQHLKRTCGAFGTAGGNLIVGELADHTKQ